MYENNNTRGYTVALASNSNNDDESLSVYRIIILTLHLGGAEFGHRLGAFRDGMFGEFSGQHETDGRLDFPAAQRGLFVVRGQFARLRRDAFKNVIDEGIHDRHALFRNAGIRMDLFEDLVNVGGIRFDALFRFGRAASLFGRGSLFGGFTSRLGGCLGHDDEG